MLWQQKNNYLQEERYEFERLQELYKLDQNYAEYEKTAAHVIGKDAGNWFGYIYNRQRK